MSNIAIYAGMFFVAALFSQINTPRPARRHGYGVREFVVITAVTFAVMVIAFEVTVRWLG